jgi:hypothetical protein
MATPNNNSILTIKDFFDRHNGLQRSNRFSLSFINLPSSLPQIPPQDFNPLAVTIGARAIDGIADGLAGYGPGRTIPRSQKFPQGVLMTFPVTNDHMITEFFDTWFNAIYAGGRQRGDLATAFQLAFYDDLIAQTQMKVSLLDPNGNPNATYTFYEIYPIECLPVDLNMMKTNEYTTYTVLMMFRDFTFKLGL